MLALWALNIKDRNTGTESPVLPQQLSASQPHQELLTEKLLNLALVEHGFIQPDALSLLPLSGRAG